MKFDILTISAITIMVFFTQSIALYIQYQLNKKSNAVMWWFAGSVLLSVGFLLILTIRIDALRFLSAFANPIIVLGSFFLYVGVLNFLSLPRKKGLLCLIYTMFILTYYAFIFLNDISGRTIVISFFLTLISWMTTYTLLTKKKLDISFSANFLAVVFLIYGGFHALRVILTIIAPPINALSELSQIKIQVITFLVPIATSILWTFGFVLMLNQRLNAEIFREKENLRTIFNTSSEAKLITRRSDGLIVDVNQVFPEMMGFSTQEIIGKTTMDINIWKAPEERQEFIAAFNDGGDIPPREVALMRKDGTQFLGQITGKTILIDGTQHIVSAIGDITERKRNEDAVRESRELYLSILEASPDDITISDLEGRILMVSPAGKKMFGYAPDFDVSSTNMNIASFLMPEERVRAAQKIQSLLKGETIGHNEYQGMRIDGTSFAIESNTGIIRGIDGKPSKLVFVIRDITERKRAEAQISELIEQLEAEKKVAQLNAITDSLTGLMNRRHFDEYLKYELSRMRRSGKPISLIMLDVDHFKLYNDTYGHISGDECLKRIADALKSVVCRGQDILVRYGGEEFVVILPETDPLGADKVARNIMDSIIQLRIPHVASETLDFVTVSLGVATVLKADAITPEKLVKMADEALYRAKKEGRNRFATF